MLKKIFTLLFLCSWVILFAQEPLRFTTKKGLPTNHVYDMAEDENGFMWFATKQGLVKYDGETFKTTTIQDGLPNNDTWLLELDYQERLWFFSKSVYQGYIKNDSIYKFATKNKEVLSPMFIYKTKESLFFYGNSEMQNVDNKEIISKKLLNSKNRITFNTKLLKIQKANNFSLLASMPVLYNPEANIVVFLQKEKLLIYDANFKLKKQIKINIPVTYEVSKRGFNNQGLLYNQIAYFALKKGFLFINFKNYTAVYKSFKEMVGVAEVTKHFRCFGTKNNIQISIPNHLMVFDYQLNLLNTYKLPKHLADKSFLDSKGNIWMTNLANGISLLPNTFNQSQYFLQNKKVQKINKVDKQLFVGINGKGFFQLNEANNYFQKLDSVSNSNVEIYQIKGNLFIKDGKNYRYQNSIFSPFYIKDYANNKINLGGIKDLATLNKKVYIVSSTGIISSENPQKNTEFIAGKNGLMFTEAFQNTIYVGGSDGLHFLKNNKLVKPLQNNTLLDIPVSALHTSNLFLMVGTDGRGVYFYDGKTIFHLTETDDLSIQRIVKKNNNLWLATQKGVFKIQLNSNPVKSKIIDAFYDTDGLLQNNINDIYLENNYLYAATDVGLAKLNIKNSIYKQKPQIYFKTKTDTVSFKNEARGNIEITFATLNFVNQEYISYFYRLLPTQKNWTATATKTLNFSNLSPDLYTLEIKAIDQHRNQSIKKLYLNVIPKWWQTLWARIAFATLGLFFILGIILLIKKQIRKKEEAKTLQNKRIAGLELQALRSQMNPHFVHNSLNAIQYFIQRNEVELSENYLSKFSKLIRLFFEYSRKQNITIKEEIDLLKNYLEIEKLRFEEKLNYTITVCEVFDVKEQLIPSMLLQPIVENAVNHGIFHKKEIGNIIVIFKFINKNTFEVIIEDDGIGINKSKALFKTSSKNYQSTSSSVLQERLNLLNQGNEWKIIYTILDKAEIDNAKTGTLVTLLFKQNIQ